MGTEATRLDKTNWFLRALEMLDARKEKANIDYLIPMFCINKNATEKTAKEILSLLERAGRIKIEGKEVSIVK